MQKVGTQVWADVRQMSAAHRAAFLFAFSIGVEYAVVVEEGQAK
jgi:hypothetical protein